MSKLQGEVLTLPKMSGSVSARQSLSGNVGAKTINIGKDGGTFIPSVSPDGVISWTNDKDLPNPEPVNIKGTKGDKGERGIQGVQGIQGERGEKGQKGDKGDQGERGLTGEKGADGYTPQKGVDYFDGKDGKDGKDGERGESGVYVGSGEMPENCNVQIDPDGEGESLQDMIDAALQETLGETKFQLLIDHVVEADTNTLTFDADMYPKIANVKEWVMWIGFIDCATAYTGTWHRIKFGSKANVSLSSSNGQKHLYAWYKEVGGLWTSSFAQSTNTSATQKLAAPAMIEFKPKDGFIPQYYEDYSSVTIYGTGTASLPVGTKIQLWGRV